MIAVAVAALPRLRSRTVIDAPAGPSPSDPYRRERADIGEPVAAIFWPGAMPGSVSRRSDGAVCPLVQQVESGRRSTVHLPDACTASRS